MKFDLELLFIDSDKVKMTDVEVVQTPTTIEVVTPSLKQVIWPLANLFEITISPHVDNTTSKTEGVKNY